MYVLNAYRQVMLVTQPGELETFLADWIRSYPPVEDDPPYAVLARDRTDLNTIVLTFFHGIPHIPSLSSHTDPLVFESHVIRYGNFVQPALRAFYATYPDAELGHATLCAATQNR